MVSIVCGVTVVVMHVFVIVVARNTNVNQYCADSGACDVGVADVGATEFVMITIVCR